MNNEPQASSNEGFWLILVFILLAILAGTRLTGCIATIDGMAKDIRSGATYIDDHIDNR